MRDRKDIRNVVKKMRIFKRDTPEGLAQREAFRLRWGCYPDEMQDLPDSVEIMRFQHSSEEDK